MYKKYKEEKIELKSVTSQIVKKVNKKVAPTVRQIPSNIKSALATNNNKRALGIFGALMVLAQLIGMYYNTVANHYEKENIKIQERIDADDRPFAEGIRQDFNKTDELLERTGETIKTAEALLENSKNN